MKAISSLASKNILIISPEAWGTNHVSKHHYARCLAHKENQVYFLNPPSGKRNIIETERNLWVINYRENLKGLHYMPTRISGLLIKYKISSLEKKLNIKFDIIWNFDTSRFFNLQYLENKMRIAHIVDWSENFNRDQLCLTCDLCFCTSDLLRNEMIKSNQNTFNLGHGYNLSDYSLTAEEKKVFSNNFKTKVGYIGNLSLKYIDWEIVTELIIKNPNTGFFFIGPEGNSNLGKSIQINKFLYKIKNLNNVFFLGEKASHKIPAYLLEFDILMLIYQADKYKEQLANPHKMLEYLGSGKVIISSWTEEYKDKEEIIEMVRDNAELIDRFADICKNLKHYNSQHLKNMRKKYARENSYPIKIQLIEKYLNEVYTKTF